MGNKLMTIPLSKLHPSIQNVRHTHPAADLEELAASIETLGVLQNLTVQPASSNGSFEVIAGGRRLAALKLLAKRRRIQKTYPVPCRVVSDGGAAEISLAENVVRAPLHPADQFEAFSKLHAEGRGIEDIAARFGIAPKLVQQRLKLAAISPKLMEVYRQDDMSLDQLVAFTITDDHTAQERVWFEALGFDRQPNTIRRMLTRALVEGSDRRAKFIGPEAYEAAGGTLVRDLFRTEDEAYYADSQLLDRLVSEKLAAEADRLKAHGWAWVEVLPELDYGYLARFRRLSPTDVPLSEENEARLSKLAERHDEIAAEFEETSSEALEKEFQRVSAELNALAKQKEQWTAEQKAQAGVALALDYHSDLNYVPGLVKQDHAADSTTEKEEHGQHTAANESRPKAASALPDPLIEDLTAHRTAALREAIAAKPGVAFAAVIETLVRQIFFSMAGESCIGIQARITNLKPSAEGIAESKAVAALAARHQHWLELLPEPDALYAWLVQQSDDTCRELLAYCVALSVNAVRKRHESGSQARIKQANSLATAVDLDMADWWEPTRERYLSRVSKAHILAAVTEAVSKQAAENIAAMKKEPMALRAEELLAGSRWLPEILRTPAVPEPTSST